MRTPPRSVILLAAAACGLAAPGLSGADDSRLRRYELPDFDALEMTLPPGWLDSVEVQPGGAEFTIELRPELGGGFEAFITPGAKGLAPGRVEDAETIRAQVRDAALRLAEHAGQRPEIRRLQGADGVGYYFIESDQEPPPGELPHLVQGALLAGGLVLRFEILTGDADDPAITQALAMLQGAIHRDRGLDRP